MALRLGLKNLKPAGRPGRARLFFWKAAFPQSGPAVSEKAWVSPAVPKAGRTGRLGTLFVGRLGRANEINEKLQANDPILGLASVAAYQHACRALCVAGLGFGLIRVLPLRELCS